MTAFLYTVLTHPDDDSLELEPCPAYAVTEPMWAELAAQLACEPATIPCTATTLARRWQEGYTAIAVWQDQIVSHLAVVPIACRGGPPGAPHTWVRFCAAAGVGAAHLPSVDVYEIATGWTAPAWRGKRICLALRLPLLARFGGDDSLVLGGMVGLASPVLARLSWHILGWSATPFVSSLIAMPLPGLEGCGVDGWRLPAVLACYEGPPVDLDDLLYNWSQSCYFAVSDRVLAYRLDNELAELCRDDLCRWRLAILDVLGQPGALHKLAWLP